MLRFCWLVVFALTTVATADEFSLETIMADPDWIGNEPQNPYFGDDGTVIYFQAKRSGENFNDHFAVLADGSEPASVIADDAPISASNASRVISPNGSMVAWTANGDVFLRGIDAETVVQVTKTSTRESRVMFLNDGRLAFLSDGRYRLYDPFLAGVTDSPERGYTKLADFADIRFSDDPSADPAFDTLRANQQRLYTMVVEDLRREQAAAATRSTRQQASPNGAPLPVYAGKDIEPTARSLSPNGQHMVLVTEPANHDGGPSGIMPNYVTIGGQTETAQLRSRVGRNIPAPQTAWLYDGADQSLTQIDLSTLPGIDRDPLLKLRKSALDWHVDHGADRDEVAALLEAPGQRTVAIEQVRWHPNGHTVALQVHSIDNKDRWIVTVDVADTRVRTQHRLTDAAWINYLHNDMGWIPGTDSLWFLSEESGYSQLYTKALDERRHRALTDGNYVISNVTATRDGRYLVFVANAKDPAVYEIHRVSVDDGSIEALTDIGGVNSYFLSLDERRLGIAHSEMDRHPDLFAKPFDTSTAPVRLTDTVSAEFKAVDWVIPTIVKVPSSQVDEPIYSKLYLPKYYSADKKWPAVVFVHGAGYTQNAHAGWPYYFREFMFHSLLTERGFVVIDMDYRASRGYGRDWRTAIYQNMGRPELEDFTDGIDFLVDNYNVDRDHIGIYGGSYGGFMTFMALFLEPDLFAAGAALRPVADWQHYNHGYTSNILNTPLIDPEAYVTSSPIHYTDGLTKPLLIAAGMQDDNVFFQDSVLVVQRLQELGKENFELAAYPLDPHGFVHAEAWLDEYRRILKLMETHVLAR
ncbi:MAG: alpha/beta fold hydrolase [Pseudomonadota bacterium]